MARAARLLGLDPAGIAAAESERLVDVSNGRIEFHHPLVRSAVYGDADSARRRACHRALADVLPDAEADRRAWHLALGSLGPDDAACAALEQAARSVRATEAPTTWRRGRSSERPSLPRGPSQRPSAPVGGRGGLVGGARLRAAAELVEKAGP